MIGRLIYFLIVVVIACLLAWATVEIVSAFEFIPMAIKNVVKVVAWALAIIAILWTVYRLFAGSLDRLGPPAPPA